MKIFRVCKVRNRTLRIRGTKDGAQVVFYNVRTKRDIVKALVELPYITFGEFEQCLDISRQTLRRWFKEETGESRGVSPDMHKKRSSSKGILDTQKEYVRRIRQVPLHYTKTRSGGVRYHEVTKKGIVELLDNNPKLKVKTVCAIMGISQPTINGLLNAHKQGRDNKANISARNKTLPVR